MLEMLEWISIEAKLPNNDSNVLAFDLGEGICVAYRTNKGWWAYPQNEREYFQLLDITHWMPLPQPPEN